MKFTMNTAKMNSILGRLAKGVGSSKILPITEYLKLELVEGTLSIVATDSANFIEHVEQKVEGEDGIAIVKADKLIKLVSKTTKSAIEFTLKETHLEVKGNGTYKVELFETNEYPTYDFNTDIKGVAVKTSTLKKAFAVNKSAIATEMLMPCLTGYNIGSDVITTDGVKMCLNDTTILHEQRALIPQKLADLLSVLNTEEVYIQKEGNKLLFTTESVTIFGTELEGLEEYPDISVVTTLQFPNYAIVKRQQLLDALDRLSLFVDNTTNYGVKFTFSDDFLYIEDLKEKSTEKVGYVEKSQEEADVELLFNISYVTDLLSALGKEDLSLYYSSELPLKIKEESVTLVLSTMTPE
jgi:DNA polymerase III subunit beta